MFSLDFLSRKYQFTAVYPEGDNFYLRISQVLSTLYPASGLLFRMQRIKFYKMSSFSVQVTINI